MANNGKCSLNNMLQAVLSVANEEQSMFYSPRVYQDQFNAVTSLLISALVKAYPLDPVVIDQLDPFVKIKVDAIKDGYFNLPDDYRDLLGTPYVFINPNKDGECGASIEPITIQSFQTKALKGGCSLAPVIIYPESEFMMRVNAPYDYPTWEKPIGYYSGKRQIKVCPFDASRVGIMYVREEIKCVYGYIMQPDDTFLFDPTTTIDSEWTSTSFHPIFNALCHLYSIYSKDQEMGAWAQLLSERGIL